MFTFFKAQLASLTASIVDYCCTIIGTEILGFWYGWASAIGTIIGGLTNFSMGRRWAFRSIDNEIPVQMFRYILVWTGYLLLTTSGVFLLTHFWKINYLFSKLIVSLVLAVSYNYPLQKRFVFK
jgi:putative flippase GtrA